MPNRIDFNEAQRISNEQEIKEHQQKQREYYSGTNRIDKKFQDLGEKKALISFITGGHFGYETTKKLVLEMEKNGVDIVEIGVPFSDPVAEGAVIQKSSAEALSQGATLAGIFRCIEDLRVVTQIPILLMLYINSIFAYGTENFFQRCREYGVDGVIVPDLPLEEYGEISEFADRFNVHSIHLIAPTSKDRIDKITKDTKGFIYCVSSNGVTGMRSEFQTDFDQFFSDIKKHSSTPACVGFGISNPEQAKKMSKFCDGVIVGSAIVKIVSDYGENSISKVAEFVKSLRDAIDN
ncbi:tryptophan synthase alpha chain [Clostridia bacterium]|nr:tryptophan synthase alpha chain [Clostridia bacterium]